MRNDPESVDALRRVGRNFAKLLGGRAGAAVLAFVATALTARALGPQQFGLLVLVHTYVAVIYGLFNFKPFEAVIRYGVPALESGDEYSLRRLLRLCFCIDFLSSLAAALLAVSLAPLLARYMGWSPRFVLLAVCYSLVLLSAWTGTTKGILRLFDRFDLLGRQLGVGPLVRCAGAGLCYLLAAPVEAYVAAWAAGMLLEQVYLIVCGWRVMRSHVAGAVLIGGPSLQGWRERFPGLGSFVNVVYWQSNLDLLPKHLSTLLAGAVLGPAAAGLFRLARELSNALAKPSLLLRQVLFPDLARMHHRGAAGFALLLSRVLLGVALFGLLVVTIAFLAAEPVLALVYGEPYRAAAAVLTLLLLAASMDMVSSVLRAAGYAAGEAGSILRLHAMGAFAYLLVFVAATPVWGLSGAGTAACIASLLTLAGMLVLVRRQMR